MTPPRTARPVPYAAIAGVLGELSVLLRRARKARGLDLRTAAEQIGYSRSTVGRIEAGEVVRVDIAAAVLRWLDCASAVNRTDTEEAPC